MRSVLVITVALMLVPGCQWLAKKPVPPPPCSSYHAPDCAAAIGPRVLLLPLSNESCFPQAADQVRDALASELQCVGHLEVVVPPCNGDALISEQIHLHGRFDEAAMLALAHTFGVDTILVGSLTDYQPYVPQRIGLSLRLISPGTAAVISSVDGLWDARDKLLADQVMGPKASALFRVSLGNELVLASPQRFARFVGHQAVEVLLTPGPGAAGAAAPPAANQPIPEMREVQ